MKLLFDECVPRPLRDAFVGHHTSTVEQAGLKGLKNGTLLKAAATDFDVLVTVDRGFEYQQNLQDLPIAILLIRSYSNQFSHLIEVLPAALEALERIAPREFIKVGI